MRIRLHGVSEEISKFTKLFKALEESEVIDILQQSKPYADRGTSKYYRVYLDVALKRGTDEKEQHNIWPG